LTLKTKISLFVSLLFSVIYAVSATVIYLLFADFRQEEFESRLKNKALSSIKLLVEVERMDKQLLSIIDQNNINKLYDEKTLIFDSNYNLIYSSLDYTKIKCKKNDLDYLKKNKTFFRKYKEQEVYGIFYDTNEEDFYAFITATDNNGNRKLEYLLYILLGTYVIFTIICWVSASYLVKKLLLPLDIFHHKINGINENNLDTRIIVKDKKDEIDLLASEFNLMLERIDDSYQKQKEFTSHASHELRTPIARVVAQLENKISEKESSDNLFYKNLLADINQLSELISSLLLLSKLDNSDKSSEEICRIDELIFESAEKINKLFPDFKMELIFSKMEDDDYELTVQGNKSLLLIAFINLLKNAYLYSDNKQAIVTISATKTDCSVTISNNGNPLTEEEQSNLFQPFMRGKNAKNKSGLGLGLKIVERILSQHNTKIHYFNNSEYSNNFTIIFTF
jgi:two-component system sensor histidine kinase ArlS